MGEHVLRSAYRTLLSFREEVATQWGDALFWSSFSTISLKRLHQELGELYALFCDVLCGEPFNPAPLSAIGIVLVRHHFNQPDALSCTLEILATQVTRCGPDALVVLSKRLPTALARIAFQFDKESKRRMLREQEEVSQAVFESFRQLELALRESEERYRQVIRWLPDSLVIHLDGQIVFANQKAAQMLGFNRPEELLGRSIWSFVYPEDVAKVRASLENIHLQGFTVPMEVRLVRTDGQIIYIEGSSTLIPYMNQEAILSVGRDITSRKRAEQKLQEARRRLANAREVERLRLAQDLHDGSIQHLLGLSFQMARLQRHIRRQSGLEQAAILAELDRLRQGILETVQQLRQVVAELRPAGLEELGLVAAIENFVATLRQTPDCPTIRLHLDKRATDIPQSIALCLFRVFQEAVRNAIKHAGARHIDVTLQVADGTATLLVHDDGHGFTLPTSLSTLALSNHFGLLGIAERVSALGGKYAFNTQPGKGTCIQVTIPLGEERDYVVSHPRSAG